MNLKTIQLNMDITKQETNNFTGNNNICAQVR